MSHRGNTFCVGNQYMTAPAFGSLQPIYKKIAFSFAIPTIVYLGSLYSVRPLLWHQLPAKIEHQLQQSVSARFVFFRIFRNSHHRHSHTITAWSVWTAIVAVTWIFAFIIAEVIPFFNDLLSLMSSLFGSSISNSSAPSTPHRILTYTTLGRLLVWVSSTAG